MAEKRKRPARKAAPAPAHDDAGAGAAPAELVPARPAGEGGVPCRRAPFEAPRGNRFVDDGRLARGDVAIDRKLNKGLVPSERRPPSQDVTVTCARCGRQEVVPADLASRSVGGERVSHVCLPCLRRGRAS